jgi:hypothetical protein
MGGFVPVGNEQMPKSHPGDALSDCSRSLQGYLRGSGIRLSP